MRRTGALTIQGRHVFLKGLNLDLEDNPITNYKTSTVVAMRRYSRAHDKFHSFPHLTADGESVYRDFVVPGVGLLDPCHKPGKHGKARP